MRRLALILLSLSLVAGASRDFDGSADHFTSAITPRTIDPMSHACWGDIDDTGTSRTLFGVTDTAGNVDYWDIRRYSVTDGGLAAERGTTNQFAVESGNSTGAWHHWGGTFLSSTTRDAWFDNGFTNDGGNSGVPAGIDHVAIGSLKRIDPLQFWSGQMAFCGMWSVELTDTDMAELFAGMWPSWVHNKNLVVFYPLMESASTDSALNRMGNSANDLVDVSAPAVSANGPPVFFPIGGM